jgi:hypothetical protein
MARGQSLLVCQVVGHNFRHAFGQLHGLSIDVDILVPSLQVIQANSEPQQAIHLECHVPDVVGLFRAQTFNETDGAANRSLGLVAAAEGVLELVRIE